MKWFMVNIQVHVDHPGNGIKLNQSHVFELSHIRLTQPVSRTVGPIWWQQYNHKLYLIL